LFKADYGQDYCWIVAEHNDFPVRLFFNFDECGWADIVRHYTNGSSYNDDYIGSWHFAKYDLEYSYAVIRDNIENYFYKFEESMKDVYSTTVCKGTIDESPMAYKDTDEIKNLIQETCTIKFMMIPKINIKAADGGD
jgi:hypothetical protein